MSPEFAAGVERCGSVIGYIFNRFNEVRELNKMGAWRQFQRDLGTAAPFIVPQLIPLKDLIAASAEIEDEIKGSSSQVGKSNEELLASFLSGGDDIHFHKLPQVEGSLDNPATMIEGDTV